MGRETHRRDELESLVTRRRQALIRSAMRILHDLHEAEDVVQETLAAVCRRLDQTRVRNLRRYVFRAVRLNALKRRARAVMHLPLQAGDAITEPPGGDEEEFAIGPIELELAILQLPETQRIVIRMKYYVGLTFDEIGKTLSISASTTASRCRYAIAKLRKGLSIRKD